MSLQQIILVVTLAVVMLVFLIGFRSYVHKATDTGVPSHQIRRDSSLSLNIDIDSERALENPCSINKNVLRATE